MSTTSSPLRQVRQAKVERKTKETAIICEINLDGVGNVDLDTGVAFLDHMLEQIAKHGLFDLKVHCQGDTHIDDHHSVEDIGITLGKCFNQALGEKRGIVRFSHGFAPLDESLVRCVVDISGRAHLAFRAAFSRAWVGRFDTDLVHEFWQAFVGGARITLHFDLIAGKNAHHQIEALFKASALALRMAVAIDERKQGQIPSTKDKI